MQHNRKIIYLAGFLFSLPIALVSYINSSFISSFTGEKYIGVIYVLGSIISIFALLFASKIFVKMGGYRFLLLLIFLNSLSFLALSFIENIWGIIFIFILGFSMNSLIILSLDELLKIFSLDSGTGKTRGIYLAICSSAWILSQLASGTILVGFSFRAIYLTSFFIMMLLFIVSFFKLKHIPDPKYDNLKILKYVKNFFQNKNLSRAYGINFLLQFFYCWMVIYTPIYLYNYIGFSWGEIGVIFAVMLLPFILIPFHIGKYGDRVGERKMLMLGFTIAGLSTLYLFFTESNLVWVWALLLFATRVGAATIEVMSDAYFFKHIKPENEEYVGVYRSVMPVSYIIGPMLASLFFIFIPAFNFIYMVLGAVMLYGIYLSSTIRKSDI